MKTKIHSQSGFLGSLSLIALLFCVAAFFITTAIPTTSGLGFFHAEDPAKVSHRTVTFEERVAYQLAIEDVYWRHRIWPQERPDPKPALDAVMSQAQLEEKVADYLRNSQALEDYWQRPLTAEQLQAEMERMAQNTKQPQVLHELFEALGNDPFVIAECLARPLLAERLVADSSAQDKTGRFESARTKGLRSIPMAATLASVAYTVPTVSEGDPPCIDDTWTATSTINAPAARASHTAVWTGSEMIVWGGYFVSLFNTVPVLLNTGGRYNPSTNSWAATSTTNAPTARRGHTAVWTGSEMIVWGGSGSGGYLNTGGRYNPSTDSWTATSTTNVVDAGLNTAVWTGSEMIVWAGSFSNGGRYNPHTDTWAATSTINAPTARRDHTAIWTGNEMIVWGGRNRFFPRFFNTGGRYCAQPVRTWQISALGDFNHDGKPDYLLYNASTRRTAVWYMNNNVFLGGAYGPTLPAGWQVIDVADFNGDGNLDYALFNPSTRQTAIWYLSGVTFLGGHYGPTLPSGWALVATGDFNHDGKPDYVLYNASTRQTAIWYMNNNVFVSGAYGPTLPAGWSLASVADFNGDGKRDYLLVNASTRQTAIWYMSNNVFVSGAYGPTIASGYHLQGTADFNGGGKPDYLLFSPSTRRTAIWYLNNNIFIGGAYGPTLP